MVCKKCEKKISKAAAPDPFRNRNSAGFLVSSGSGSGSSSAAGPSRGPGAGLADGGRKVGENKLLSKANRYNPIGTKCKVCKQTVSQDRATYCQGCAYKRGVCAICGKQILDTRMYKQSAV